MCLSMQTLVPEEGYGTDIWLGTVKDIGLRQTRDPLKVVFNDFTLKIHIFIDLLHQQSLKSEMWHH